MARQIAVKHNVPPSIFLSLIEVESGWNPQAISSAGAIGLTQLMPGTARSLGVDPFVPRQNLEGGARYLREQYENFGNWRDALRAYNVGPNAIRDPSAGAGYADKVLDLSKRRRSSKGFRAAPRGGDFPPQAGLRAGTTSALPPLFELAFADDPSFLALMRALAASRAPQVSPASAAPPVPAATGPGIMVPTSWKGTHVTSGLGWGTKTALDIMGTPGTPVRLPWRGSVIYFRPEGAQGGGSMLVRLQNGRELWLGHIMKGLPAGSRFSPGQVVAYISPDHPRPHLHVDIR